MKKTALCSLVCAALGLFSLQASAENLQNVYQLALKKDPQVLKSAAQRDAAKAGIDISKANFLPDISLTSTVGKSREDQGAGMSATGTGNTNSLSLSQTVFNWGN